jgi:hypothetical protein
MTLLPLDVLGRHAYVIGGTGTGKSRWLEDVFLQLMRDGIGVGNIDPHGELYNNLVARIAATGDRRLWERVILVDPSDPEWSVGINPVQPRNGELVERKAQFLAGVVARIWRADELLSARMTRMMLHSFWLLANQGLTLAELPLLLGNKEFRKKLIAREPIHSGARHYFANEFPRDDRTIVEWTQSTLNKAGQLAVDPEIRLMLGQQESTIDFQEILDQGLILLVNLSKGTLLAENAHILGGFVMAQLQQAALARARQPDKHHKQWVLFADEFHNYTTETIQEILVESRKYKLSLVFANQVFGYLREMPELQAAILNSVGNLICFRMGDKDAQIFAREIFQPSFEQVKDIRVRYQKVPFFIWEVNQRFDDAVYRSVEETWEYEMRKLTGLADRQFWWKQRGPAPARAFQSRYLPDVRMTPRLQDQIAEMKAISNQRWARRKRDVERDIQERQLMLLDGLRKGEETSVRAQESVTPAERSQLAEVPASEVVDDESGSWLFDDEIPWYWDGVE